jgi:hypothetical protein
MHFAKCLHQNVHIQIESSELSCFPCVQFTNQSFFRNDVSRTQMKQVLSKPNMHLLLTKVHQKNWFRSQQDFSLRRTSTVSITSQRAFRDFRILINPAVFGPILAWTPFHPHLQVIYMIPFEQHSNCLEWFDHSGRPGQGHLSVPFLQRTKCQAKIPSAWEIQLPADPRFSRRKYEILIEHKMQHINTMPCFNLSKWDVITFSLLTIVSVMEKATGNGCNDWRAFPDASSATGNQCQCSARQKANAFELLHEQ